jgi:heat shock protein HslJ
MDKLFIAIVLLTALIAGYVVYDTAQDVGIEIDRQSQTASVLRNKATSTAETLKNQKENIETTDKAETNIPNPRGSYILSEVNRKKVEDEYGHTLLVTSTKISGRICNLFSGTYTVSKDSLAVGPLAASKMACQGEVGIYEQVFFKIINSSPTFVNKEGQMTLTSGPDTIVFTHVYE